MSRNPYEDRYLAQADALRVAMPTLGDIMASQPRTPELRATTPADRQAKAKYDSDKAKIKAKVKNKPGIPALKDIPILGGVFQAPDYQGEALAQYDDGMTFDDVINRYMLQSGSDAAMAVGSSMPKGRLLPGETVPVPLETQLRFPSRMQRQEIVQAAKDAGIISRYPGDDLGRYLLDPEELQHAINTEVLSTRGDLRNLARDAINRSEMGARIDKRGSITPRQFIEPDDFGLSLGGGGGEPLAITRGTYNQPLGKGVPAGEFRNMDELDEILIQNRLPLGDLMYPYPKAAPNNMYGRMLSHTTIPETAYDFSGRGLGRYGDVTTVIAPGKPLGLHPELRQLWEKFEFDRMMHKPKNLDEEFLQKFLPSVWADDLDAFLMANKGDLFVMPNRLGGKISREPIGMEIGISSPHRSKALKSTYNDFIADPNDPIFDVIGMFR